MAKENLAENMRLFYVAVTRAVYQCYIGISASTYNRNKNNVFAHTHWAHLLGIEEPRPDWATIQAALEQRFGEGQSVDYRELGDVAAQHFDSGRRGFNASLRRPTPSIRAPESFWQIASYSRLAHGNKFRADDKGDDEVLSLLSLQKSRGMSHCKRPMTNAGRMMCVTPSKVRVSPALACMTFSSHTGSIPMRISGSWWKNSFPPTGWKSPPARAVWVNLTTSALGAAFPGRVADWLQAALVQPLENPVVKGIPSLKQLFSSREVIPELAFDFAIGSASSMLVLGDINQALLDAGLAGLEIEGGKIHGLMTGAIDLVFVHDQKIYVLDYKSNTLGKAPRFYDQAGMSLAMAQNRFDLQYMIYSTAVHRYFSSRFAKQYSFDEQEGKSLSFGGVFYLFLRGMGLSEKPYRQHGVWFTRPQSEHISALERAFGGSGDGGRRSKTATATGKRKSR